MTSETIGDRDAACFTIIWALENYCELPCHLVSSPWISDEILNNTRWLIELKDEDNLKLPMSCTIFRGSDGIKESIDVNFEVALLDFSGKPIVTKCGEKSFAELSRSEDLELIDKVFILKQKDNFQPNDILTLRCRLWVKNSSTSGSDICFARTFLGLEKREFIWTNKEFSSLEPEEKRSLLVQPLQKGAPTTELSLYLKQTDDNEDVIIEVNLGDRERIYAIMAKFSIVEAYGKITYTRGKGTSIISNENNLTFEPFIQNSALQTKENDYLLNDTLFLLCELKTSYGEVYSRLENYGDGLTTILPSEKHSDDSNNGDETSKSVHSSSSESLKSLGIYNDDSALCCSFCPLKKALKQLQENGIAPDVRLTNGYKSFYVHRDILGKESHEFKKMFYENMGTKNFHIETKNLHYLLTCIYTGVVGSLDTDIALDLLEVSQKYNLTNINKACSEFLLSNSSSKNKNDGLALHSNHQEKYQDKNPKNENDGLALHSNHQERHQDKNPKRKMRHVILDAITSTFF